MMLSPERLLTLVHDISFRSENAYDNRLQQFFLRACVLMILPLAVCLAGFVNAEFLQPDEGAIQPHADLWTMQRLGAEWRSARLRPHSPLVATFLTAEHELPSLVGLASLNHFVMAPDSIDGYRLTAIFVDGACAVLLYFLLRRLEVPGAFLGAALVAVHPVNIQAIMWIDQQDRLWGACFALGFAILYFRLCRVPEPEVLDPTFLEFDQASWQLWRYATPAAWVLAPVLLLAAAVCFPPAGAITLLLPVVMIYKRMRAGMKIRAIDLAASGAWITLAAIVFFLWARQGALTAGAAAIPGSAGAASHALTIISQAAVGVFRLLAPWPVVTVNDERWTAVRSASAIVPVMLWLALLAVGWIYRQATRWGVIYLAIALAVMTITVIEDRHGAQDVQFMPNHDARLFMLSMLLLPLLAGGVVRAIDRIPSPVVIDMARLGIGALLVVGLGSEGGVAAYDYHNTESLWLAAVHGSPGSPIAAGRLAEWYLSQNRFQEASRALESNNNALNPSAQILISQGQVLSSQGDVKGAIAAYLKAKTILGRPDPQLMSLLANAYIQRGQPEAANDCFRQALAERPGDVRLLADYGAALLQEGQPALAVEQYRKALEISPQTPGLHLNLSAAYFQMNDLHNAASELRAVNQIDSHNFDAFYDAGVMLLKIRDFPRARDMLQIAVQLKSDSFNARNNLGIALAQLGELDKAIYEFQEAVKLNPNDLDVKRNLAIVQSHVPGGVTTEP